MKEELQKLFNEKRRPLKAEEIMAAGITYKQLIYQEEKGGIKRFKSGYYILPEAEFSEEDIVLGLFEDGIFTMDTALYYHGYIEQRPKVWSIAISKNVSKSRFKIEEPKIKPYYTEPKVVGTGAETKECRGRAVNIYNKDRLICEVLKYEKYMDPQIYRTAVKAYIDDEQKNVSRLLEYAAERKVLKKIQMMIGPWLPENVRPFDVLKNTGQSEADIKHEIPAGTEKPESAQTEKTEEGFIRAEGESVEQAVARCLYAIATQREALEDISAVGYVYKTILENQLNGKNIWRALSKLCEGGPVDIFPQGNELYKTYLHSLKLRDKWDDFIKRQQNMSFEWEEVLDLLFEFYYPIQQAFGENRAFVGDWMPEIKRFL